MEVHNRIHDDDDGGGGEPLLLLLFEDEGLKVRVGGGRRFRTSAIVFSLYHFHCFYYFIWVGNTPFMI